MTQISTNPFTPEIIKSQTNPAWLEQTRLDALEIYHDRKIPTTSVESWKYTNLRRFKPENFTPAQPVPAVSSIEELPAKIRDRLSSTDAAGRIVLSGSSVILKDVPAELAAKGVILRI